MTALPAGWITVRLSDVAEVRLGRQRSPKNHSGTHMRPYLRAANVDWHGLKLDDVKKMNFSDAELAVYRLDAGDLLLNEASGSPDEVGKPALWNGSIEDCCFQNTLIRVRSQGPDVRFLLHFFRWQALRGAFASASRGVGIHHIGSRTLADWPVQLPPLAEQRRIVDALEDHLSRLDAATASLQSALRRVTACLDAAITSVIRPAAGGNATPPEPAGVIDGALPSLPTGWRWRRLHEIAEVVGGVTKDAGKQSDPQMPEVPFLRVANVQRGRLDLSKVTSIRVPAAKAQQLALVRGDVLLNEGGDRDKLGRGWVWAGELPLCIHQNHVFRARIHDGELSPKLLSWHANTFGRWFEVNGKQSVNLASISLSKIRLLPVPVPPRDEQPALVRRIEEQLTLLDHLEQSAGATLEKARGLQRSLLQQAFSGRLAPQDPGDESACVLLKRLNSERDAEPRLSLQSDGDSTAV